MNRRNLLALVAGVVLSLTLTLSGSFLAWRVLVGADNSSSNKEALINFMLVQVLGVNTFMAVVVGLVVGWLAEKSAWWLAGVSLLPLLIYGVFREGFEIGDLALAISYVLIGLIFARLAVAIHTLHPGRNDSN